MGKDERNELLYLQNTDVDIQNADRIFRPLTFIIFFTFEFKESSKPTVSGAGRVW